MRNHMLSKWILGIPIQRFSISCWLWKQMWMFSQDLPTGTGQNTSSGRRIRNWSHPMGLAEEGCPAACLFGSCNLFSAFSHFRPQNFKTVWINDGPELPSQGRAWLSLVRQTQTLFVFLCSGGLSWAPKALLWFGGSSSPLFFLPWAKNALWVFFPQG